jgi:hypothetical protein
MQCGCCPALAFFVGKPIAFKGWHKKPVFFLHSGSPLVVSSWLHQVTYSAAIGLTISGLSVVCIVTIQCCCCELLLAIVLDSKLELTQGTICSCTLAHHWWSICGYIG